MIGVSVNPPRPAPCGSPHPAVHHVAGRDHVRARLRVADRRPRQQLQRRDRSKLRPPFTIPQCPCSMYSHRQTSVRPAATAVPSSAAAPSAAQSRWPRKPRTPGRPSGPGCRTTTPPAPPAHGPPPRPAPLHPAKVGTPPAWRPPAGATAGRSAQTTAAPVAPRSSASPPPTAAGRATAAAGAGG